MTRQRSRQQQGGCASAWLLFVVLMVADSLGMRGQVSARRFRRRVHAAAAPSYPAMTGQQHETGSLVETGGGSPRLRVACVGDSLTRGDATHEPLLYPGRECPPQFGGRCYEGRRKGLNHRGNYPAELQRLLGPGFHVRNFGVGGCTASRTLPEHPSWPSKSECDGTEAFHDAVLFRPHVVVTMMGTNDSKEGQWDPLRFAAALVDMAQNVTGRLSGPHGAQEPPAWVLVVPPPVLQTRYSIQPHVVANEVPPEVFKAAAQLQETLPKRTAPTNKAIGGSEPSSSSSCGSGSVQVANMQEAYGAQGCRWCEGCEPKELHRKDRCGRLFVNDSIHTSAYGSQVIAKAIAAALSGCQPPPAAVKRV